VQVHALRDLDLDIYEGDFLARSEDLGRPLHQRADQLENGEERPPQRLIFNTLDFFAWWGTTASQPHFRGVPADGRWKG